MSRNTPINANRKRYQIKGVEDPNSKLGSLILALSVSNDVLHKLENYKTQPSTTPYQHHLVQREYEQINQQILVSTLTGLNHIKDLRHSSERKSYTAALQDALKTIMTQHSQNMDQTQLKGIHSVLDTICDYSHELNQSRNHGSGF